MTFINISKLQEENFFQYIKLDRYIEWIKNLNFSCTRQRKPDGTKWFSCGPSLRYVQTEWVRTV